MARRAREGAAVPDAPQGHNASGKFPERSTSRSPPSASRTMRWTLSKRTMIAASTEPLPPSEALDGALLDQQLFEPDRQLAHTQAGSVIDRVGDGSGRSHIGDFADTL